MNAKCIMIIVVLFAAAFATAADKYEGSSECDAMKVTVAFSFDAEKREIRNLRVDHECIEGSGFMTDTFSGPIAVDSDGSFSVTSGGVGVSGSIDADGTASGSVLGEYPLPQCADGEFHPVCKRWFARKK